MQVDTDRFRDEINHIVSSQTRPTITVLSSLLATQDEFGYIPDLAIEVIAEYTNHTINEVWGVASFYPNFRFTKPGENILEICWGPTCHLAGAAKILNDAKEAAFVDGKLQGYKDNPSSFSVSNVQDDITEFKSLHPGRPVPSRLNDALTAAESAATCAA